MSKPEDDDYISEDDEYKSLEESDEEVEKEVHDEEIIEIKEKEVPTKVKKVINTKFIAVNPDDYMTTDRISNFEYASILSERTTHIAKYDNCFVDTSDLSDPMAMAIRELDMGACPLMKRRVIGEKIIGDTHYIYVEYKNPNDPDTIIMGV